MPLFQYQALAEPTAAAATRETPGLDKWYRQPVELARPQARRHGGDGLVDRECCDFGEGVFTRETPQVDKWEHFFPDWLRPLPRLADRDCLDFGEGVFTAEAAGVDKWEHFLPDWLRPLPRLADRDCLAFGEGVFTAESPGLDKFLPAQNDPTRNRTRPPTWLEQFGTTLGVFRAETAGVDKWQHFYPDHLRPAPRLADRDALDLGEGVFNTEAVTADRWTPVANLPVRPPARLADRDAWSGTFWQNFAGIFAPGSGFPYPVPEGPPRPPPRLTSRDCLAFGAGVFTLETAGLDKWAWPQNDPSRNRTRLPVWLESFGTTLGKFVAETVFPDKWAQPPNLPPRPAPRPADREAWSGTFWQNFVGVFSPAFGFPYPTPESSPRPSRRSSEALGDSRPVLGPFTSEAAGLDKWYAAPNLPARPAPRPADRDGGAVSFWANFAAAVNPALVPGSACPEPARGPRLTALAAGEQPVQPVFFPAVLVYDQFADADGTNLTAHAVAPVDVPAAVWRVDAGSWQTSGSAGVAASLVGENTASLDAGIADGVFDVDITIPPSGSYEAGLALRVQDAAHHLLVIVNNGPTLRLLSENGAGNYSVLGSAAPALSGTVTVRAVLAGSSVSVYLNGTLQFTATTSLFQTATRHGLHEWRDGTYQQVKLDNFRVASAAGALPEAVSIDRWLVQPDLPVRNRARTWWGDSELCLGVFTFESVTQDRWYVQQSEPPRPTRHVPYAGLGSPGALGGVGVFNREAVTADRWAWRYPDLLVPVRRAAPVAVGVDLFWQVLIPPVPSLDRWFRETELPVRGPRRTAVWLMNYATPFSAAIRVVPFRRTRLSAGRATPAAYRASNT